MLRYAKKVLKLAKISFKLGLLADVYRFEREVTKSNVVDNNDLIFYFLIFQNFIFSYFVIIFYLIDFYLIFFF